MADFPTTLDAAVRRASELWPDRTAWIFDLRDGPEPETSVFMTFAEVAVGVDRVARHLRRRGVLAGQRVGVMLHNRAEYSLVWLALARLGATMVPINVKSRHDDAAWIIARSRAVALVSTPELAALIEPTDAPLIDIAEFEASPDNASPLPHVCAPEDTVNVQFTSGTTGRPKGCLLSNHYWLHLATSLVDGFPRLTPADRMLTAQSMSYMDPQWTIAAGLVSGAGVVVLDGFHPSTIWDRMREHGVTHFYCVASMPILMLSTPPSPQDRDHRVRVIQCSAIPPGRHAELEERWGAPWFEVFGMSESGGDIHVTDEDHDECVGTGTIGRAKPGREVRIVDSADVDVPVGEVGELLLRGPGMMSGYDDDPEATADIFRGGWLHTGDLARQDERGYLWIVGRVKDMIRRAGENIAAREVEDTLVTHPHVRMAAVVGVPDELRGEEIKAYVQLTGDHDVEAAAYALSEHCRERLARFKVPRYWEFRDDLPRTPSERVAKTSLVPGLTWDAIGETFIDMSPIELTPYDAARHGDAVRRVYESAFPASLRAEWPTIHHHRDDEELLVLTSTQVLGFTLIRHLGDTGAVFIRYFAIDDDLRGQGHGSLLMERLIEHLTASGAIALLLDVEDPVSEPENSEHVHRISFYERNGVRLLTVPGYAPPDHGSTGQTIRLLLMGRALADGPALDGSHLDDMVDAVLLHRYGVGGA
jgi:crotonobetaine/carnitine-CoA ligase